MATSGSSDFTMTRDQIARAAMRKLGIGQGRTLANTDTKMTEAFEAANVMIKSWQGKGIFVWCNEWTTQGMTASSEVTGTDGEIYTCIRSHTAAATDTPVTGANYTNYWRKDGATGGVWAETAYTAIGDFTVATGTTDIVSAFIRYNDIDFPVTIRSITDYFKTADKWSEGIPDTLYFHRLLTPRCYLDPKPLSTDMMLHYLRVRLLEDFDASTDNADFPVYWLEALIYNLAYRLAPEYQVDTTTFQMLQNEASRTLNVAMAANNEGMGGFVEPCYGV